MQTLIALGPPEGVTNGHDAALRAVHIMGLVEGTWSIESRPTHEEIFEKLLHGGGLAIAPIENNTSGKVIDVSARLREGSVEEWVEHFNEGARILGKDVLEESS